MSAEERWAQRKEWDNERGELEVKEEYPANTYAPCDQRQCWELAKHAIVVGPVQHSHCVEVNLCDAHKDDWADVYHARYAQI